jgi:hypothetical protein
MCVHTATHIPTPKTVPDLRKQGDTVITPEFRPYRARLLYRGQPRLDGAWYPVDLDWRPGGDLDTSYNRLSELFRRLTAADNANRSDLDFFALEVQAVPAEGDPAADPVRWVPTRPDTETRRSWW